MPDLRDDVRELFAAITGREPDGLWSAPGVVTLAGGDPDAGDALVVAIDRRVVTAAGARDDGLLRIASAWSEELVEVPLAELDTARGNGDWSAHALGVVWALGRHGADLAAVPGVDLVIESTVPAGLGLGSSTAVSVAVATALRDLWRLDATPARVAAAVHRGESEFAGAPSLLAEPVAALAGFASVVDAISGAARGIPFDLAALDLAMLVVDAGLDRRRVRRPAVTDGLDLLDLVTSLDTPVLDSAEGILGAEIAREHGALAVQETRGALLVFAPVGAVSRIQVALDGGFAEHGFASHEVFPVRPSFGAARDA